MDVGDVGIAGPGPADSGEMGEADFGGLFGGMEGITGEMGPGSAAEGILGQMPMGLDSLFADSDITSGLFADIPDLSANLPDVVANQNNPIDISKMSKFAGIVAAMLGQPGLANMANMTSVASSNNPISGMISMGLMAANPALGMLANTVGIPGMIASNFSDANPQGINSSANAAPADTTSNGSTGMMDALPGLLGMYAGYQGQKDAGSMLGGLQSLYGQDSPYAQVLRQQLQRRDAAGGRRSQYGPREVELQAKLAQMASGQIGNMSQLQQRQNINRAAMLQQGLGAFKKMGGFGGLQDLFGLGGAGGMYETAAMNGLNNGSLGNIFGGGGNIFSDVPSGGGYNFDMFNWGG